MSLLIQYLFLFLFISTTSAWYGDGWFLEWIWPQNKDSRKEIGPSSPLIRIPFELKTDDEKFLEEAAKFTDLIKSSALDSCQHKVVLKIESSCSSMTEEELGKMSVNLLNCQLAVDGRETFPCPDQMSLKKCTEKMNLTMWNAYHMMNNRARAVCLAARRSQFQALSEMTVNKLMSATHNQIAKMDEIVRSQDRLEKLTLGTVNLIEKGNIVLLEQQHQLKSSQQGIRDFISHNVRELVREKALIAAGHEELARMTQSIKAKMDEANDQLFEQVGERMEHQKQLLTDLNSIHRLTEDIFYRIGSSTDKLLLQHSEVLTKYEEAVKNLKKMNETVSYLLHLVDTTRLEIDEKIIWMQHFLYDTGIPLEEMLVIIFHIIYLLIGMLLASFLNISTLSRIVLTVFVPLNLLFAHVGRTDLTLNYVQMTSVLIATTLVIAVINRLLGFSNYKSLTGYYRDYKNPQMEDNQKRRKNERFSFRRLFDISFSKFKNFMPSRSFWMHRSSHSSKDEEYLEDYHNDIYTDSGRRLEFCISARPRSEISSNSLVRDWLENKAFTPNSQSSRSNDSPRMCSAISLSTGQQCRNSRLRGMDICVRHRRNKYEMN